MEHSDTADISIDFVSDNESINNWPETNTVTFKVRKGSCKAYFTLEGIESEVIKTVTVRGLPTCLYRHIKTASMWAKVCKPYCQLKQLGQMVDIFGATILYASDNDKRNIRRRPCRAVGVGVANITATIKLMNVNYTSNICCEVGLTT